jgi:hypothetical protein
MRWLWGALVTGAFVSVGCGSSGGGDQVGSGDDGGSDATVGVGPGLQFDGGGDGSSPKCTPRTCQEAGANCGPVADGCGGLLTCGDCTAPATCGGGGTPSVCGGTAGCKAKDCATLGATCGPQGDGCGNVIDCGTCTTPQTCGGGGTGSQCGGTQGCVPKTTCPTGQNCGAVSDGCGGSVDCSGGAACPAGEFCGGGGKPNVCGSKNILPDGGIIDAGGDAGNTCTPIPKATACSGMNCGIAPDGCGNTYTCGTCTVAGDSCGGGGTANQCGHAGCTPITQCPANIKCGSYANGCGGTITCGTCTGSDTCGGGGTAYQCGHPACTPLTKCPSNVNCGPWPDGCGGTIASCGSCNKPAICGGSGVASQCGDGTDGGFVCQGLQCNQVQCDGGATTSISGTVLDPAGLNPVYNAVVFVPPTSTPLADFKKGVSCDTCADQQTSLISVTTGPDGTFKLLDVPVVATGTPVVIQIGRWRREILVDVKACQDNPVAKTQTHLPQTHTQTGDQVNDLRDDIPQMAISTGSADPFECLLVKMGIATSEFVNPTTDTTGGRIHYYRQNGIDLDSTVGGPAPKGSTLWTSAANLENTYDIVLLPCEGAANDHGNNARGFVGSYADNGGRVFITHYSYEWAAPGNTGAPWGSIATWDENQPYLADPGPDWCQDSNQSIRTPTTITGTINQGFKKGADFATWLQLVGATTTKGQLTEHEARHDLDSVPSGGVATPWITTTNVNTNLLDNWDDPGGGNNPICDTNNTVQAKSALSLQHMTFNTPTNAALNDAGVPAYCGRVVYSDFHVSASALTNTKTFPGSCQTGALSAQEKALEFMLFDLSSCIQPDNLPPPPNPTCTKATKCPAGIVCGTWPDGCGGDIPCGTCTNGKSCVNGACVGCTPLSCSAQGISCGSAGDGCGGTQQCQTCPTGQLCQGGACITPGCTKVPCPSNIHCGLAGDGCGGTQSCGTCGPGTTCGGGGTPGTCGAADADTCAPLSCKDQGLTCGKTGDGCGNLIDCGTCTGNQTCGGGGTPGTCGAPSCTPKTCTDLGANCGKVADGCGGLTADCGDCTGSATCGGGGTANQCGVPPCTPRTCQQAGANCGPIGDGCGNILQCGDCSAPQTCGGGGTPSVCGGGIK